MIVTTTDRIAFNRADNPRTADQPQRVPVPRPWTVLIAEYRDEVFARLAGDVQEIGHVVLRATRSDEVPGMYRLGRAELLLCHIDLPDGSGWLTATRLQAHDATARIWLYAPWASADGPCRAELLGIEEVIYYRGDLFRLSDAVRQRFGKATRSRRFAHWPGENCSQRLAFGTRMS